jgi:hypothetical protein
VSRCQTARVVNHFHNDDDDHDAKNDGSAGLRSLSSSVSSFASSSSASFERKKGGVEELPRVAEVSVHLPGMSR